MSDPESRNDRGNEGAAIGTDDRRCEPRFVASGEVNLLVGGPRELAIPGRILDISLHGMRVEHMYAALTSGLVLTIQASDRDYTARVVWNRINDDGVESGFYLL